MQFEGELNLTWVCESPRSGPLKIWDNRRFTVRGGQQKTGHGSGRDRNSGAKSKRQTRSGRIDTWAAFQV
jgi:hypothetical protein